MFLKVNYCYVAVNVYRSDISGRGVASSGNQLGEENRYPAAQCTVDEHDVSPGDTAMSHDG
jgi:hypothetical protein